MPCHVFSCYLVSGCIKIVFYCFKINYILTCVNVGVYRLIVHKNQNIILESRALWWRKNFKLFNLSLWFDCFYVSFPFVYFWHLVTASTRYYYKTTSTLEEKTPNKLQWEEKIAWLNIILIKWIIIIYDCYYY